MSLFSVVNPVTIRSALNAVHSSLRRSLCAVGAVLILAGPAYAEQTAATSDDIVALQAEDVRQLAMQAVQSGDFGRAILLARGLLRHDPEDPVAYFVLAIAHGERGDITLSRKAAGYAFRYAETPDDRFRAGQIAAQSAFYEERYSLAQIWLRRTAIHADTEAQKAIVAKDYKALRRLNPWSLRIDAAVRPSSNVNNGSEDALQIIDGVPVTGRLSGAAQALSGLIATLDVRTRYRLHTNANSATHIGLRGYTRHVALSSSAQAKAPTVRNSDLSQQFFETSLGHRRKVNAGVLGGTVAIGQSWYGNNPTYRFARATADRVWETDTGIWYGVSGSLEERNSDQGMRFDATAYGLNIFSGKQFSNGDELQLILGFRNTDAWFINDRSQAASLRAAYSFGEMMGPVKLDLALTLGYSDYPNYQSGFIIVPGGRQDKSVYADVNLMFEDWDYAGFAPSLRIRAGRTSSNDSRFQTRELSIGLGIQSKF